MDRNEDHLEQLAQIRTIMERSTRFLSLSGLAGVSTGIIALAGAAVAWMYLDYKVEADFSRDQFFCDLDAIPTHFVLELGLAALATLTLALGAAFFFTRRKAQQQNLPLWDKSAVYMLTNLAIPLVTGGIFCLILLRLGICGLIAPVTLVFYGLALLNASKYTLNEIRYLGVTEIALGLLACLFVRESLLFWALGFGVLHIIYGVIMYYRYER